MPCDDKINDLPFCVRVAILPVWLLEDAYKASDGSMIEEYTAPRP